MGWLVAVGIVAAAILLLGLTPVQLHLQLAQADLSAHVQVEVRVGPVRLQRQVSLGERARRTVRRVRHRLDLGKQDVRELLAAAAPGLRYLGRATRCPRLRLRLEVGGLDACDSALLAGLGWGAAYILVAQIGRLVRLDRRGVAVAVVPNFQRPLLRTDLDCILRVRLGKATLAAGMVLRAGLRRRALLARIQERWRRKGDRTGGRAPDSRPHEDGHGKPEEHGGREHRHR